MSVSFYQISGLHNTGKCRSARSKYLLNAKYTLSVHYCLVRLMFCCTQGWCWLGIQETARKEEQFHTWVLTERRLFKVLSGGNTWTHNKNTSNTKFIRFFDMPSCFERFIEPMFTSSSKCSTVCIAYPHSYSCLSRMQDYLSADVIICATRKVLNLAMTAATELIVAV